MKKAKKKFKRFLKEHNVLKKFEKAAIKYGKTWDDVFVGNVCDFISCAFDWSEFNDGYEFWKKIDDLWREFVEEDERRNEIINDVLDRKKTMDFLDYIDEFVKTTQLLLDRTEGCDDKKMTSRFRLSSEQLYDALIKYF